MDSDDVWDAQDRVPFESQSNLVEFVTFEERLRVLIRASDAVGIGVSRYLFDLRESVAGYSEQRDSSTDITDESGELIGTQDGNMVADAAEDQLSWAESFVPTFSFGGIFALVFTTFELLLSELCDIAAERCSMRFAEFTGASGAPLAERYLEYLSREMGITLDRKQNDWVTFEKLRQLRNRFVHSLGEDVSSRLRAELAELMGSDKGSRIDGAVVQMAVQVIARIATRLDAECASHNL